MHATRAHGLLDEDLLDRVARETIGKPGRELLDEGECRKELDDCFGRAKANPVVGMRKHRYEQVAILRTYASAKHAQARERNDVLVARGETDSGVMVALIRERR